MQFPIHLMTFLYVIFTRHDLLLFVTCFIVRLYSTLSCFSSSKNNIRKNSRFFILASRLFERSRKSIKLLILLQIKRELNLISQFFLRLCNIVWKRHVFWFLFRTCDNVTWLVFHNNIQKRTMLVRREIKLIYVS